MGGALTILAAVFVPEVDAAVAWYGFPPLEYVDASKIKAPLMGHFAIHDGFFKIEQVDQLEAKLKAAGVKYTFYRYDAGHAFASDDPIIHTVGLKRMRPPPCRRGSHARVLRPAARRAAARVNQPLSLRAPLRTFATARAHHARSWSSASRRSQPAIARSRRSSP